RGAPLRHQLLGQPSRDGAGCLTSQTPDRESGMSVAETSTEGTGEAAGTVLSVRDLSTSFKVENRWQTVVRNVSFDVGPRETVAIVGESGSGKSVTSLSIMRLLPKASSRIEGSVRL